jgi:hypothetical protein
MTDVAVAAVPVPAFHAVRRHYPTGRWLIARNRHYSLDETADFIWCTCDGSASIADVAEALAEAEGRPLDEALAATLLALDYFRRAGLVSY